MRIRVRAAFMGDRGPQVKEAGLEVEEGLTVAGLFKRADKLMGLDQKVFRQALKGRFKSTVLLNGDRLDLGPGRPSR